MNGYERITRNQWESFGGFSNPLLCRVERSGKWVYYKSIEYTD